MRKETHNDMKSKYQQRIENVQQRNHILRDLCISFFIGIPVVMLIVYLIAVAANHFNV